ncbi:MAG: hypothetical protein IT454_03180 [Planctomycetes bacterium]|nr:hypothetical protein [Planctomycetota bacterium]
MTDNPYSAPRSAELPAAAGSADSSNLFTDGVHVFAELGACFPSRCVLCNAPAELTLRRRFSWHSPWWALTILAGVLTYLIVALVVRKSMLLELGLCAAHARRRRRVILGCWILPVAAVGACALSSESVAFAFGSLAAVLALAALMIGQRFANVLTPVRIDAAGARLRGASPAFLATLPHRSA